MGQKSSKQGLRDDGSSDRVLRKAETVLSRRTDSVVLVSEHGDPGNYLGVLRTADTLGVQNVHIVEPRKSSMSLKKEKQTREYVEAESLSQWMDLTTYKSMSNCLALLKQEGYAIWLADCQSPATSGTAVPITPSLTVPSKVAVVVGGLGKTNIKDVNSVIDKRVFVPMYGFSDHLSSPVQVALVLNTIFMMCPKARTKLSQERMQEIRNRWHTQLLDGYSRPASLSPRNGDESSWGRDSWPWNSNKSREAHGEDDGEFHDAAEYFDQEAPSKEPRDHQQHQQGAFSLVQWGASALPSFRDVSRECQDNVVPSCAPADSRSRAFGSPRVRSRQGSFSHAPEDEPSSPFGLDFIASYLPNPFAFFAPATPPPSQKSVEHQAARRDSHVHPSERLASRHAHAVEEPTLEGPARPDQANSPGWCRGTRGGCSQVPGNTFLVRSSSYLSTSLKEASGPPICSLISTNIFTCARKVDRINERLPYPELPPGAPEPPAGCPRFLCVNLQFPVYNPSFFSNEKDGQGFSIAWMYHINYDRAIPSALPLLKRFLQNGTESNGESTRERLKLIMRLVNLDEAARTGATRPSEKHLLDRWNAKPVMVRPQQRYFRCGDTLEICIDVHLWKYIIRKMLLDAPSRFHLVVWDLGLLIQGNKEEELPEQMLCAGRCHYIDLTQVRPLPPHKITAWKKP